MNSEKQSVKGVDCGATCKTRWTPGRIIELALLVLGLIFIVFFFGARVEGYFVSHAAIEQFDATRAVHLTKAADGQTPSAAGQDFSGWSDGRVRAYAGAAQQNRGIALAVLEIPRIQLDAPVFDGTDELTLNHAVGLIEGTAWPGQAGNIGIAGHRDGFFRKLKDIRLGDEIKLETRTQTYVYTAYKIQIVTPRDVSVLQSDAEPSLTLVTCYPFYSIGGAPKRFVVKAHLKGHNPAGTAQSASRLNPQSLNPTLEEQ